MCRILWSQNGKRHISYIAVEELAPRIFFFSDNSKLKFFTHVLRKDGRSHVKMTSSKKCAITTQSQPTINHVWCCFKGNGELRLVCGNFSILKPLRMRLRESSPCMQKALQIKKQRWKHPMWWRRSRGSSCWLFGPHILSLCCHTHQLTLSFKSPCLP